MKKLLALLVATFIMTSSRSQVIIALLFGDKLNSDKLEFGLNAGLNLSDLTNMQSGDIKPGLNLALYFNIKISEKFYIHPEAIPKYPGGVKKMKPYSLNDATLDQLFADGEVTRKIRNIALPVLLRYNVYKLLYAEAGPQIGLRTKANDIFKSGDLTYDNEVKDQLTRFDFGVAFGISHKLTKDRVSMALGIRYYIGLTDIDKLEPGSQKNRILQAHLSFPIGAHKEASSKEGK